jgi:hypothetical protein
MFIDLLNFPANIAILQIGGINSIKEASKLLKKEREKLFNFGNGLMDLEMELIFFIYRSENKDISQFRPEDSYGTGVVKLKNHWFWQTIRS